MSTAINKMCTQYYNKIKYKYNSSLNLIHTRAKVFNGQQTAENEYFGKKLMMTKH